LAQPLLGHEAFISTAGQLGDREGLVLALVMDGDARGVGLDDGDPVRLADEESLRRTASCDMVRPMPSQYFSR
jgi:phage gp45-like